MYIYKTCLWHNEPFNIHDKKQCSEQSNLRHCTWKGLHKKKSNKILLTRPSCKKQKQCMLQKFLLCFDTISLKWVSWTQICSWLIKKFKCNLNCAKAHVLHHLTVISHPHSRPINAEHLWFPRFCDDSLGPRTQLYWNVIYPDETATKENTHTKTTIIIKSPKKSQLGLDLQLAGTWSSSLMEPIFWTYVLSSRYKEIKIKP